MRDSQSTHRPKDTVGTAWLFALIGAPSAALGAVHSVTAGLFFFAAAAFLVYRYGIKKSTPPAWDLPTVTALGLMGFTAIQILPLPAPLVSVIAPAVFEIRSRVWAPMGLDGPGWMPLSLDVSLTVVELGKIALYLSVYWGAVSAVRKFGPGAVLRVLTAAGILGASILLVHKILMLDKVYGVYTPIFVSPGGGRVSAPLLNENHMAAFLGICSLAAVGRAVGRRDRSARIAGFGAAAFIGGALMLTLSRGGIAAFVAAQSLFAVMRVGAVRGRAEAGARGHWAWLFMALALSLGLGFFAAQDAIFGEFLNGNVKKIDLFFEGLPLAGEFWTTGVGRGAFWVGFHLVSGLAGGMTVTHAENAPVQLLADWGIPVGAAALVAAAWMVGRFLLRPPSRPEGTAAAAALVGFGIHNLVDFNMEIPGVAVAAVAMLGVLYGGERKESRGDRPRVERGVIGAVAGTALLSAAAAFFYVRVHSVDATERRFQTAYSTGDAALFSESALKPVLNRHPAAAYLPFLKGVRLYHGGTKNPLPWLARAIELYPRFAAAHFYVGGTLLKLGRVDQAMLEFRLAAREDVGLVTAAAGLLVSRVPRFETLSRWAVTDADKRILWPALARALAVRGYAQEAELADDAVLAVDPSASASGVRRIRRLIARGELEAAEAAVEKMAAHPRNGIVGATLSAELYQKTGAYERAVQVLERGIARFGEHPVLVRALAWARQRNGDFDGALEAAGRLKARAGNAGARMRAAMLAADLHLADGRVQGALAGLREAYGLAPGNTDLLRRIFQLADRHGDRKRAVEALRLLSRLEPEDRGVKAELEAYEKKAALRKLSVDSDIF